MNLAFRKKIAALTRESAGKEKIVNNWSKNFGSTQCTVQIVENTETGERGLIEYWGETRNIPRALRTKRTAGDMLDDDEEINNDETGGQEHEEAEMWNDEERVAAANLAARRKKKAPSSSSTAKKQKKTTGSSSSRRGDGPASSRHNNGNSSSSNDIASSGTRRSARVASGTSTSTSASSRTPRPASSRREPIIREDEEEHHTTSTSHVQDNDTTIGIHHIDEYHLRRSTRAASDDLVSLSDRMNNFEIKSEAGSGESPPLSLPLNINQLTFWSPYLY